MEISGRKKLAMVITLLCGSFITAFSETLMNNGLPTIMKEVHVDEMTVQWLSTGYMLIAGITMPLAPFLIKRFELRELFTTTMSIFLLGTLIATFAPNFTILLIGRLIEGIAVGINMPLIPSVLSLIYPPNRRGTVMGLAGIIINLGPAIGPTISGIIVDSFSWRMLFIVLIPISLTVIIATRFLVKSVLPTEKVSLDFISVISSIFGLGSLLYGLGRIGQTGKVGLETIGLLVFGILVVIYFVRRQLKLTKPLLEMKVYRATSFRLGAVIALLNVSSLMATELMLPLFNQNIIKVSPMISGIMLIPSAIVMTIVSPLAGRLYDNFGIKKVAFLGMGFGLLTTLPMIFYTSATSASSVTWIYAARCGALTLAYAPLTVYALNALPKNTLFLGQH